VGLSFEASQMLTDRQIFLLSFLISPVEAIQLSSDLVKTLIHFTPERPNLGLQLFPQK